MPNYSYVCEHCDHNFEEFFNLKDYTGEPIKCPKCKKKKACRNFALDVSTQIASVKKADSELKTLGDLAKRNTDRMSDDEKESLRRKHNAYKEDQSINLPEGMTKLKTPKKPDKEWKIKT